MSLAVEHLASLRPLDVTRDANLGSPIREEQQASSPQPVTTTLKPTISIPAISEKPQFDEKRKIAAYKVKEQRYIARIKELEEQNRDLIDENSLKILQYQNEADESKSFIKDLQQQFKTKHGKLKEEYQAALARLESIGQDYKEAKEKIRALELELSHSQQLNAERDSQPAPAAPIDNNIAILQAKLTHFKEYIKQRESDLIDQIEHEHAKNAGLSAQVDELQHQMASAHSETQQLHTQNDNMFRTCQSLQKSLEMAQDAAAKQVAQSIADFKQANALREQHDNLVAQISTGKDELNHAETSFSLELARLKDVYQEDLDGFKISHDVDIKHLEKEKHDLEKACSELQLLAERAIREKRMLEVELDSTNAIPKVELSTNQLRSMQRERDELVVQLESLQGNVRRSEDKWTSERQLLTQMCDLAGNRVKKSEEQLITTKEQLNTTTQRLLDLSKTHASLLQEKAYEDLSRTAVKDNTDKKLHHLSHTLKRIEEEKSQVEEELSILIEKYRASEAEAERNKAANKILREDMHMLDKLRKLLERNDHKLKASQDQIRELVSKIKQESEEKIRLQRELDRAIIQNSRYQRKKQTASMFDITTEGLWDQNTPLNQ